MLMEQQNSSRLNNKIPPILDDLAEFARGVERALHQRDFSRAAWLIEENIGATWYGFPPHRTSVILRQIVENLNRPPPLLLATYRIISSSTADISNTQMLMESLDADSPSQMYILAMFRMTDFRMHGYLARAVEQGETVKDQLRQISSGNPSRDGWLLHAAVQTGTVAMLAGDFTCALGQFLKAQVLPRVPQFPFLEREAIVKSALIHACFGNAATADGLLKRTGNIQRSSSWSEGHIDTQEELVRILTYPGDVQEALERLEAISLQDISEMWPFYIVAFHRVLEGAGHHDELEHQLEMFDSLPFPQVEGDGFTGSVIPLKRAMVALHVGRGAAALKFMARPDPELTYTKLTQSAVDLYVGKVQQAKDQARNLRKETRGFRLLEIRRLSVLATAQFVPGELEASVETLKLAAALPRGLSPHEITLFSPDIRKLAEECVPNWPTNSQGKAIFLPQLPKPGHTLTGREVKILELLSRGLTRAEMAEELFVSVSTIKTQLRSLYRKLEVSSAADAIFEGERRGVL